MKQIDDKTWKEMYNDIVDSYNSIYVLSDFCHNRIYSEDICYTIPILKFVFNKIDNVYAEMIKIDDN